MSVKRSSLAAIACVILFSSVDGRPYLRTRPAQAHLPQPAFISGHVYSAATGAPLTGAKVTIGPCYVGGVPWGYNATTAADGSYSVEVRPFCYFLTASHAGYAPQDYGALESHWARSVSPQSGEHVTRVDFHLQPEAILSGTIYDYGHQPAVHVRVCAGRRSYSYPHVLYAKCERTAWTDEQGHFRLDALSPAKYYVQATFDMEAVPSTGPRPGWTYEDTYYPWTGNIVKATLVKATPAKETQGLNFSLAAVRTYTVTVVAQDRLPGQGHHFYSFALDPSAGPERGGTSKVHVFERVPPGRYRITVLAKRHGERTGTTAQGVHWTLPETQSVGGGWREIRVTGADVRITVPIGKPAAIHVQASIEPPRTVPRPVQITLYSPFSLAGQPTHRIQSSETFGFYPIFPNSYLFSLLQVWPRHLYLKQVRCAGRVVTYVPLPIQPGENVTCQVTLGADPAAISGYVTENGKPAKNAYVLLAPLSASQRETHPYADNGQTDNRGHYVMQDIAPGHYLLFAVPGDRYDSILAPGFVRSHQAEAQEITLTPNATLTTDLKL